VKALFAEPQYPEGAAQTISKESGAKVYTLDPVVTGNADETAADAYINAMKKNAQVLKEALQ
jgi:zinc transport system substrate-binding protein